MKTGIFFATLVVLVSGCATHGAKINSTNNQIRTPHYSYVIPDDTGWRMREGPQPGGITLTDRFETAGGAVLFQIVIAENGVLDKGMQTQSARAVADDFRNREERIMIEQGVNTGQYELRDVKLGEEVFGNKTFYTMKYKTIRGSRHETAGLYLYLPKAEGNKDFIVVHYSESSPRGTVSMSPHKSDLISILESLALR